ncbi:MAG: hypothetical protein PHY77_07150 [Desulfotomaculaceae bacterium]|nr:hypothetical protein [Desulfotomaculaceae bacterium]
MTSPWIVLFVSDCGYKKVDGKNQIDVWRNSVIHLVVSVGKGGITLESEVL